VSVQLVSKISDLCGPDPPTSQTDGRTDGRTDDMRSQYRAMHYSASRGNKTLSNTYKKLSYRRETALQRLAIVVQGSILSAVGKQCTNSCFLHASLPLNSPKVAYMTNFYA